MRGCFVFCLQVFPRRSPVAVGSSISVPDTVTVDPFPLVESKAVGITAPAGGYQARTHYEKLLQTWLAGGTSAAFAL